MHRPGSLAERGLIESIQVEFSTRWAPYLKIMARPGRARIAADHDGRTSRRKQLNKRIARNLFVTVVTAVLVACVTINVYFPEAAAERAADRFIQDVIGPETSADGASGDGVSHNNGRPGLNPLFALIGMFIPSAHAQSVDIDIESPQINAIKQRMTERQREHLAAWLDAGAIGLDNSGLIEVRDRSAVSLSERREMEQVVAEENADRRAVYREIAVANGHPEWEERIRETFAERWVANARAGWYYQDESGNWLRK